MKLDKIDLEILRELQHDASISNLDLSKKVGVSASTCLARTKLLNDNGFINRSVSILNPQKLGLNITTFTFVNFVAKDKQTLADFLEGVKKLPEVQECYTVTGDYTFIIKIVVPDIQAYRDFFTDKFLSNPCVTQTQTNIVVNTDKYTTEISLDSPYLQ